MKLAIELLFAVGALTVGATDWTASEWISAKDAPVFEGEVKEGSRAADGTSWFVRDLANAKQVKCAKWAVTGLGVFEIYINGQRVGEDFLKPGYTHCAKTKYAFTYDVTGAMRTGAGERNTFAAEVSAGWWRDKIVSPGGRKGFFGRKSAFRGVLEVVFADGTTATYGTDTENWKAGTAGPVTQASIFDGEHYDARQKPGFEVFERFAAPERNEEFKGEILPSDGAEVLLRRDLTMKPLKAYGWKGVEGGSESAFGKAKVVRTFAPDGELLVEPGETLVVDFGQNAAAVPEFAFEAVEGTVLTVLPAEMLNDNDGLKSRGNDGPEGSAYRVNLRTGYEDGRLIEYTFAGAGVERYLPRFTFFGYRYLSLTATAKVRIRSLTSVPVSSIRKEQETGRITTGIAALNQFISNVYWGQLSNYLSVPTDCPQRNERLGWTADTQVFCETASFNADVYDFLRKWMRDERDSQHENGAFASVAPFGQYGNEGGCVGWADAGVIVPYTMWKQFGDTRILRENYEAMARFLAFQDSTCYKTGTKPDGNPTRQYADWLSFEDYEPCNGSAYNWGPNNKWLGVKSDAIRYWNYLAGCYWHWDALMMAEMAAALGKGGDAAKYGEMAGRAMAYLRREFVDPSDGRLIDKFRHLQGAALFALKFGVLERTEAIEATRAALRKNFADHDGCLTTGFLGTSIIMDTLVENGMTDIAYSLLLNHKFPSWLYSVDQGATTVWERWNSYTKKDGFGPVSMNSFNHYAYGAVLGWVYHTTAGIASDAKVPGFRNVIMAPKPDRRLGFVTAEYRSAAGPVKSAWRYAGDKWIWDFTVPDGATATVTLPGEQKQSTYPAGTHHIEKELK